MGQTIPVGAVKVRDVAGVLPGWANNAGCTVAVKVWKAEASLGYASDYKRVACTYTDLTLTGADGRVVKKHVTRHTGRNLGKGERVAFTFAAVLEDSKFIKLAQVARGIVLEMQALTPGEIGGEAHKDLEGRYAGALRALDERLTAYVQEVTGA